MSTPFAIVQKQAIPAPVCSASGTGNGATVTPLKVHFPTPARVPRWRRQHGLDFPVRVRWAIVRARVEQRVDRHRLGLGSTWRALGREVWQDLIYLFLG